jgi:hypothetical protein
MMNDAEDIIDLQEKCTRLLVQIVDKRPRFLLNPMAKDRYIAKNVIGSIDQNEDSNMRRYGDFLRICHSSPFLFFY